MMWRALAALCALLALVSAAQTWRLSAEQRSHAETRADHARQIQALAEAARKAEAEARAEEQRRTAEVQKAADEATQAMERARADAAAAADAGQRLRDRIRALSAAACRGGAEDTAAAGTGPTADAAARVLADVQRRLDEAADRIARHADAARAAGAACERAYHSLSH